MERLGARIKGKENNLIEYHITCISRYSISIWKYPNYRPMISLSINIENIYLRF